jgi:hypothetical protein
MSKTVEAEIAVFSNSEYLTSEFKESITDQRWKEDLI